MALADDLVEQARHLATWDAVGRPRQANLRRAISSAYYALFHFLIDQACRSAVGGGPERRELRGVITRAFDHAVMKRVAQSFAGGTVPSKLQPGLGTAAVPADLRRIAQSFRDLQEERHAADYDLLRRFEREDVLLLVDLAQQAMRLWPNVRDSVAGRLFLPALLVAERIRE